MNETCFLTLSCCIIPKFYWEFLRFSHKQRSTQFSREDKRGTSPAVPHFEIDFYLQQCAIFFSSFDDRDQKWIRSENFSDSFPRQKRLYVQSSDSEVAELWRWTICSTLPTAKQNSTALAYITENWSNWLLQGLDWVPHLSYEGLPKHILQGAKDFSQVQGHQF